MRNGDLFMQMNGALAGAGELEPVWDASSVTTSVRRLDDWRVDAMKLAFDISNKTPSDEANAADSSAVARFLDDVNRVANYAPANLVQNANEQASIAAARVEQSAFMPLADPSAAYKEGFATGLKDQMERLNPFSETNFGGVLKSTKTVLYIGAAVAGLGLVLLIASHTGK
jgi:hypothetical protein